ncbi:MAG: DNA starvation/stationary phase protection protein [Chloroflexota bacterium]|nr:MAG: DNA starvation/stationary phase protection protein [Chloroflexota bacterium]
MATRSKTKAEPQLKIDIGLTDEQRQGSIEILNTTLCDLHVLYIKTRNYHWNVVGPHFYSLHGLFEEQYNTLAESIDLIAERIRMAGGIAMGSMEEFIRNSRLKEHKGEPPNARDMVLDLLHDHEMMVRCLRQDIETLDSEYNDVTNADVLTAQAEIHEKMAWMLAAIAADDHSLDHQNSGNGRR